METALGIDKRHLDMNGTSILQQTSLPENPILELLEQNKPMEISSVWQATLYFFGPILGAMFIFFSKYSTTAILFIITLLHILFLMF